MSINAIEQALWKACENPVELQRLREDANSYLKDFRMDEEERALVASWEVGLLAARGVNPLLILNTFTAVKGMSGMMDYLTKINTPIGASPAE